MKEKSDSRIEAKNEGDNLIVRIKAYKEDRKQSLLFTWVLAWSACGIYVISQYFLLQNEQEKLFVLIWIAFWLYFEYKVVYAYRWRKSGVEELVMESDRMSLAKLIGKRGIPRYYDLSYIKNLRIFESNERNFFQSMMNAYWNVSGEKIAFEHKGKTVLFGMNLEEREAKFLIKNLKEEIDSRVSD